MAYGVRKSLRKRKDLFIFVHVYLAEKLTLVPMEARARKHFGCT